MIAIEKFSSALRTLMAHNAQHLLERMLVLMEQDIEDGWRAFYAREIWLRKELPVPWLNELGTEYMVERLREAIWRPAGQLQSEYESPLVRRLYDDAAVRAGYRNFLDVGTLKVEEFIGPSVALDVVADEVATRLLEQEHRHMRHEYLRDAGNWYIEASARCSLTEPLLGLPKDDSAPVRNPAIPLEKDGGYWHAVYPLEWRIVRDVMDYPVASKPQYHLELMAQLAPDFPYSTALSKQSRLVFVQDGEGELAWALMIDKTSGSPDFRYPPQLILIERGCRRKLQDKDILFSNVIGTAFYSNLKAPRCVETELRFHLPRCRRLIDVYQPYVEQAWVER
nr:hypothetical protein [Duganella sp. sic0402]